jgi:hypothetical protein
VLPPQAFATRFDLAKVGFSAEHRRTNCALERADGRGFLQLACAADEDCREHHRALAQSRPFRLKEGESASSVGQRGPLFHDDDDWFPPDMTEVVS